MPQLELCNSSFLLAMVSTMSPQTHSPLRQTFTRSLYTVWYLVNPAQPDVLSPPKH